jgi:signal transduction histidine kinase
MEISFETASQAGSGKVQAEMVRVQSLMTDLQRYLDNFLDIARMETVIVKPVSEKFELFGLFQKLALQFEDMAEHRKVDLRFRYNKFNLLADEKLLQRALENLIANALKFSKGKVLVAARRKGANVQIMVVDNGNGIPEQIDNKFHGRSSTESMVFKYFSQGINANKIPDHGFGLGLTIVKRMIDTLGAFLTINSVADRGTAICIELPART